VDALLVGVSERYLCCDECLGEMIASESLVPAEGGAIEVARGLGFAMGASDGCGGGVARKRSSRRMYVPKTTVNACAIPLSVGRIYLHQQ
jgi:hypothetical protein